MFELSVNHELEKAAKKASLYARADNHREAARMRRLTRNAAWKTDENLNRGLLKIWAIICFLAIIGILIMAKLN